MKKLLMVLAAFSLFANVAFAVNTDKVAEGVCKCLEEPHNQARKTMELMNKAQASGDMSQIMAMQDEIMAVTNAATRCFDDLAKKYPEIDKSEKLQEEVMAKAEDKCPNPAKMKK